MLLQDALLRVNFYIEKLAYEGCHATIDHQEGAVNGIKNGEIQYCP